MGRLGCRKGRGASPPPLSLSLSLSLSTPYFCGSLHRSVPVNTCVIARDLECTGRFLVPHIVCRLICFRVRTDILNSLSQDFRSGISDLTVHFYRYRNHTESDLLCPLCREDVEDEVHFLLKCPFFSELRREFIPPKSFRNPCTFRLIYNIRQDSVLVFIY